MVGGALAAAGEMLEGAWSGFTKWIRIGMWVFLICVLGAAGFLGYQFLSPLFESAKDRRRLLLEDDVDIAIDATDGFLNARDTALPP